MSSIFENVFKKAVNQSADFRNQTIASIQDRAESATDEVELLELAKRAYTQSIKASMLAKFDEEMSLDDVKVLMDLSGSKSSADLTGFINAWTRHDYLKVIATLQYLRGVNPRSSVAPTILLPFIKSQLKEGVKTINRQAFIKAVGAHYRAKGKAAPTDLVNPFMSYLTLLHGGKKGIGLLGEHYMGRSIDHWTFGPKASKYL